MKKLWDPIVPRSNAWLVAAPLALTIVFAKFSVPALSSRGLGIALPLVLLTTLAGLCVGRFQFHRGRLYWYLLLVGWASATQLFGKPFSLPSLAFLILVFFPYTLQIKAPAALDAEGKGWSVVTFFGNVGFILALVGIAQYFLQFAFGANAAFPIEHLLPKGVLIERFNYLNALYYGSDIYKSNGLFFLEPSFYSQFLAISLLVELCGRTRLLRIAAHLVALAVTFSGTGLLVLAAGVVTLIVIERKWGTLIAVCVLGLIVSVFRDELGLSLFFARSSEFSMAGTSGFERFVAWLYMVEDQVLTSPLRLWTGYGAGTFSGQQEIARYSVMESAFAKPLVEYGIPGLVLYFGFLIYCVVASSSPSPLKAGLIVCLAMNGAYSESNLGLFLTLLLWPTDQRQAGFERAARRWEQRGPLMTRQVQKAD